MSAVVERVPHVCPRCSDQLVYPISWRDLDDAGWWLELHCPNCDLVREVVVTHETVEGFDERLNVGTDVLVAACGRMETERIEREVDAFAAALAVDAVLPCDFGWLDGE